MNIQVKTMAYSILTTSLIIMSCVTSSLVQPLFAQTGKAGLYRAPLDIPLLLSGTFAELRSGHFHSGLDFRTGGVEGLNVYAIADGYVNRVVVSPTGFGKAVYIAHPETGHVSVYAHLKHFHGKIADYVLQQQYNRESFAVNLFPEAGQIPIIKGDLIGFSGNTGSSAGPHLHFEIRDASTQHPLNPLHFGFRVKDYIRPSIKTLAVYPVGPDAQVDGHSHYKTFEVQGWGEQPRVKDNDTIRAYGEIAFGITTFDTHNDTPNRNGVYSIELFIDSIKVFGFRALRFSFDETRYLNSFIDYAHYINHKNRIIRTEIDPMNQLSLYDGMHDKGTFTVEAGQTYRAAYIVRDNHGNISRLPFLIEGVEKTASPQEKLNIKGEKITAGVEKTIYGKGFIAEFHKDAFYRDIVLQYSTRRSEPGLSDIISLGDPTIPVHSHFNLSIKPAAGQTDLSKLIIAKLEEDKEPISIGGTYENGYIIARSRSFGEFVLMADTAAPSIRPLNFKHNSDISRMQQLRIEIEDELSGIESYRPILNGDWILMEYDAKNKLLFYDFCERVRKGTNLFEITVRDKSGNQSTFKASLLNP